MAKQFKTNALRMLDKAKISYEIKEYDYDEEHLSGSHIVQQVDLEASQIFKTLVLQDNQKQYLVCCIPVLDEIDLKKLAKIANKKSVEMIQVNSQLSLFLHWPYGKDLFFYLSYILHIPVCSYVVYEQVQNYSFLIESVD